jgi:hypothetical protein
MVPISLAVDLMVALLQNATQISQLIQQANANGKDTLDVNAWNLIVGNANTSETTLDAAIKKAKNV